MLPECLPIAVVAFSIGQVHIRSWWWKFAIQYLTSQYTINQGLGNLFGSKHGYKVPPNQVKAVVKLQFACACSILFLFQELLAQGVSNLLGSFLSCLPMSGSLSRSLVQVVLLGIENSNFKTYLQESSGCKSLLTGLTSAIFLLGVLLFLGPIFQVWWVESCHK